MKNMKKLLYALLIIPTLNGGESESGIYTFSDSDDSFTPDYTAIENPIPKFTPPSSTTYTEGENEIIIHDLNSYTIERLTMKVFPDLINHIIMPGAKNEKLSEEVVRLLNTKPQIKKLTINTRPLSYITDELTESSSVTTLIINDVKFRGNDRKALLELVENAPSQLEQIILNNCSSIGRSTMRDLQRAAKDKNITLTITPINGSEEMIE